MQGLIKRQFCSYEFIFTKKSVFCSKILPAAQQALNALGGKNRSIECTVKIRCSPLFHDNTIERFFSLPACLRPAHKG